MKRVIGYARCSTEEQMLSGLGIDAQQEAIRREAERRGWSVEWITDNGSGKDTKRAGLQRALQMLKAGEASALIVARLDRLTRSWGDFGGMLDRAQREGWSLVALDIGVDTTTPTGEAMAGVAGVFSQLERRLISERTKIALAQAKARGVRLGGRKVVSDAVRLRVAHERARGDTLQRIADRLNEDKIPTGKGGARWYPSTVRVLLGRLQSVIDVAGDDVYEALSEARAANEQLNHIAARPGHDNNVLRLAQQRQGMAFRQMLYGQSEQERLAGLERVRAETIKIANALSAMAS